MSKNEVLSHVLEMMRSELESHQLEVALAPAPCPAHVGHCVRVKVDQNPRWYRKLCAAHISGRRDQNRHGRTAIKRRETLKALDRLQASNGVVATIYDERVLESARTYWRENKHRFHIIDIAAA